MCLLQTMENVWHNMCLKYEKALLLIMYHSLKLTVIAYGLLEVFDTYILINTFSKFSKIICIVYGIEGNVIFKDASCQQILLQLSTDQG